MDAAYYLCTTNCDWTIPADNDASLEFTEVAIEIDNKILIILAILHSCHAPIARPTACKV